MKKKLALLSLLTFCFTTICSSQSESSFKLVNSFHLPGNDGWDYLTCDAESNTLYISHGTQVQVVNAENGKLIGTIPNTKGVHGIAIAKDLDKGFITCGRDSSVCIFKLSDHTILNHIHTDGVNPDAILYDKFSGNIFVFNGGSKNATVINAKTDAIRGMIALDGSPEFAVTNEKGKIYVNIEDRNEICEIDPSTMKVYRNYSISPGEEPSGLAIDIVNHLLFSVCDNKKMIIFDTQAGRVIKSLPIGEHVDGAAFDPELMNIYSSNGEGTISIVKEEMPDSFVVIDVIPTQKGARTCTINTKNHHIFVTTSEFEALPPEAPEGPHHRAPIKPDSFVVLEYAPIY